MKAIATRHLGTLLEVALLLAVLVPLGFIFVPAHYYSTWIDPEFTGWVAPIAERLGRERLYTDGMHIPMPPLPYVFMYLTSRGEIPWIAESFWVFAFQSLGIFVMFLALSRVFPRPVPLLAALSTIPMFISFGKSIFYDPLTQFFVALAVAGCAMLLPARPWEAASAASPAASRARARLVVAGLGFVLACLMLTKQNTAAGALAGVCLFLGLLPGAGVTERFKRLAILGMSITAGVAVICVIISPLVHLPGLVSDVYLHGSEPKGGKLLFTSTLPALGKGLLLQIGLSICALGVTIPFALLVPPHQPRAALEVPSAGPSHVPATLGKGHGVWCVFVSFLTIGAFFLAHHSAPDSIASSTISGFEKLRSGLFPTGLTVMILLSTSQVLRRRFAGVLGAAGLLFIASLPPAFLHAASRDNWFLWSADNNSLLPVVLAVVYSAGLHLISLVGAGPRFRFFAPFLVVAAFSFSAWTALHQRLDLAEVATDPWPEIVHLQGARLRPESAGMRKVVAAIRAASQPGDEVLLLPSDPNVEEWFERKRPLLTSPTVFTDQYWDRLVDEDFARIQRDPPDLIVIGPAGCVFFQTAYGHENWGAMRLIRRVLDEILPARYILAESIEVASIYGPSNADVFILKK